MADWGSVDEVLDFAIKEEADAAAFYEALAGKVDKPWMKDLLISFSKEELGHKAKLEGVKKGNTLKPASAKVVDLKIADYLVDVDVDASATELDYQQVLIVAMKKEKAAFKLYSDIAAATDDAGLKDTFLALAQEEAKHKLRFEVEYDDYVLQEN